MTTDEWIRRLKEKRAAEKETPQPTPNVEVSPAQEAPKSIGPWKPVPFERERGKVLPFKRRA